MRVCMTMNSACPRFGVVGVSTSIIELPHVQMRMYKQAAKMVLKKKATSTSIQVKNSHSC